MLPITIVLEKLTIFTLVTCNLIVNVQCKINDAKIIGGRRTKEEGMFMASFQNSADGKHLCGAALYSPLLLLTSCECISESASHIEKHVVPLSSDQYQVAAGSNLNYPKEESYVTVKVVALYQHPSCQMHPDTGIWTNNLGIINVEKPFEEGLSIKFISYPSTQSQLNEAQLIIFGDQSYRFDGDKSCFVYGWGCIRRAYCTEFRRPLKLRSLQLLLPDECQEILCEVNDKVCNHWPNDYNAYCAYIQKGYGSFCFGDGGSPFVCDGVMLGIVSWNYACATKIFVNIIDGLDIDFMNSFRAYSKSSYFNLCPTNTLLLLAILSEL